MEKKPVDLIKEQIKCLPKKDIEYAEKFIKNRDFEALRSLVNSDVYLVEKELKKGTINPKYADISIEDLNELKGTIDEYCNLICPDDDYDFDGYEDYTEDEEDIEW